MGGCASVRSWPCSSGDGDGRSDRIIQLRLREDFSDNMGPIVSVQPFGSAIDSHYLRWAEPDQRADLPPSNRREWNQLYRLAILGISSVADGETLHLTARRQVIYWIKNGVRDFIYNTGPD